MVTDERRERMSVKPDQAATRLTWCQPKGFHAFGTDLKFHWLSECKGAVMLVSARFHVWNRNAVILATLGDYRRLVIAMQQILGDAIATSS